jgi:hypothetical protein
MPRSCSGVGPSPRLGRVGEVGAASRVLPRGGCEPLREGGRARPARRCCHGLCRPARAARGAKPLGPRGHHAVAVTALPRARWPGGVGGRGPLACCDPLGARQEGGKALLVVAWVGGRAVGGEGSLGTRRRRGHGAAPARLAVVVPGAFARAVAATGAGVAVVTRFLWRRRGRAGARGGRGASAWCACFVSGAWRRGVGGGRGRRRSVCHARGRVLLCLALRRAWVAAACACCGCGASPRVGHGTGGARGGQGAGWAGARGKTGGSSPEPKWLEPKWLRITWFLDDFLPSLLAAARVCTADSSHAVVPCAGLPSLLSRVTHIISINGCSLLPTIPVYRAG